MIDTHCHLSDKKFLEDLGNVVKRAEEEGVKKMILPATNLKDLRKIIEITKKHEGIYGLAGIYPGESQKEPSLNSVISEIEKYVKTEEKIVGIGEIGLDAYWNKRDVEAEKKLFGDQLKLAVKIGCPVVIHNRGAEKEIMEVMSDFGELPQGQFHCWSGSDEFLDYVLEREFFVSFCGNVTYPGNEELREQVKRVPTDRLLLETDSPYLPPQQRRGERNEPKNVTITLMFLADLYGKTFEELESITDRNANELFNILN